MGLKEALSAFSIGLSEKERAYISDRVYDILIALDQFPLKAIEGTTQVTQTEIWDLIKYCLEAEEPCEIRDSGHSRSNTSDSESRYTIKPLQATQPTVEMKESNKKLCTQDVIDFFMIHLKYNRRHASGFVNRLAKELRIATGHDQERLEEFSSELLTDYYQLIKDTKKTNNTVSTPGLALGTCLVVEAYMHYAGLIDTLEIRDHIIDRELVTTTLKKVLSKIEAYCPKSPSQDQQEFA